MAVTIQFYDHFLEIMGDGTLDMDGDSFKLALMTSSHSFTSTHTQWTDVSANEIAAGNGYTATGQTLTTVTWAQTSGTVKLDADDVPWTASGGAIATTRHGILYDDTHANDLLIASMDWDADKTPNDGDILTIKWDASNGIFTIG